MINSLPDGVVGHHVRAPKTAELIAGQLRNQIVRGILKPGDTLPPEPGLMQQFGVSRPTLREAFRILENESLILVRRGSRGGVQVVSPDIAVAGRYVGLLLQMAKTTLADVYEARTVLEPAAASMLAARRTKQDLADLRGCVDNLVALVDRGAEGANLDQWSLAAYRFHDLLVERAGNQTIAVLAGVLREVVSNHMSTAVTRSLDLAEITSQFKKSIKAFYKVITLIEAKDADAAVAFWRSHMQNAGKKMLWESSATESAVDLFN